MSKIDFKNAKNCSEALPVCYNCGKQIEKKDQKSCPNCQVILNPNTYINWKKSWYGFLGFLCIVPFLIAFLFIFFL